MTMLNKNFLTEHREHLLFFTHLTERLYDFPLNDDLIDALHIARKKSKIKRKQNF